MFVSDFFTDDTIDNSPGGAEFSFEALIDRQNKEILKVKSTNFYLRRIIQKYSTKKWIIGNYSIINPIVLKHLIKYNIKYYIIEFDYKFCKFRNLELHEFLEGRECNCHMEPHGKLIRNFLRNSQKVFFMSDLQKQIHINKLELNEKKCIRLSSIFDSKFFDYIEELNQTSKKENYWVISSSDSWVKGTVSAETWCKENNKEIIRLHGEEYTKALKTLSRAEGLCFLPDGADTCPRLVIEAKLLGCQLHLNKNVQHKDEEWFKTHDLEIVKAYLKKVPDQFWVEIVK